MFEKIRTAFNHTTEPTKIYTPEDLRHIGQTLNAERVRLEEIRHLTIEELDRLYLEATGQ